MTRHLQACNLLRRNAELKLSIIYGRTVLWNLNEENEAEKDIFLVDGAPWYLLAFGQKRHECIALQCVSATIVTALSSTSTSPLSLLAPSGALIAIPAYY